MRRSTAVLLVLLGAPIPAGVAQAQIETLAAKIAAANEAKREAKGESEPTAKSPAKGKVRPKRKANPRPRKAKRQPQAAKPEPQLDRPAEPSLNEPATTSAVQTEPTAAVPGPTEPTAAAAVPSAAMPSGAVPTEPQAAETEVKEPSPLQLGMFVDAYFAWQTSGNGTLATRSGHRAFAGQGATFRAENGFALAFLGLDVDYDTPRFGATASLRFGEGAPIYHVHAESESDFSFGVDLLTQAFLTWRPSDPLRLDLGMFRTPFGAEMLESWKNLNYTRGALYYYAQPAWHTGLKLTWAASDTIELTTFIANGSNNLSETQENFGLEQSPTFGAQIGFAPGEAFSLAAGGLFVLDSYHNDDTGFDALGDVVASLELGPLRGVFNADYVLTRKGAPSGADRHLLGFSLGVGYAFGEAFGLAARGEYLLDDANFDAGDEDRWRLLTATLTADFKPVPGAQNLIVRWDNRWEQSNQRIFGESANGTSATDDDSYGKVWFESVLGVVVTTTP